MTTPPVPYLDVAATFDERLAGVGQDDWERPTPCPDWTVRDLVAHVVNTHRRVYGLVVSTASTEEVETSDLRSAWREAHGAVVDALADPALADAPVRGRAGERPFYEMANGLLAIDTLCHTWDLAHATGQSDLLAPAAVHAAHAWLEELGDSFRVPGGFGPAIESDPSADAQTAFLNLAGRRP